MFICVDDITYIETQFNHSKVYNFISWWEMVRNTIKFSTWFFLYKINKNMQEIQGWNLPYIHVYNITYVEFKSL